MVEGGIFILISCTSICTVGAKRGGPKSFINSKLHITIYDPLITTCFVYGLQCYVEMKHMFTGEYYIHGSDAV
jgi:hypothetical protein